MKKENIAELIKFYHSTRRNEKARDFVDGVLIKLTELLREGSKIRYNLSAAICYEEEFKSYCLVTRAGLSKEKISKGIMLFNLFTDDMIPKDIGGMPVSIENVGALGKSHVTYEVDTSLGTDELKNPVKLAPILTDLILSYKKGMKFEDYKIISARWEDLPNDPQIPRDKIKGYRILEINLEAKLAN
ncbi:MAG: hypothetical protein PHH54_05805 [Candidatus Nanoarchaeia archaeon]|nr:hypothetical protein [Candidatus Nanoarchaeia archaeon]MDD5741470.1 hypothetical protein [Candidatus Nanoarchaeia archaeon]